MIGHQHIAPATASLPRLALLLELDPHTGRDEGVEQARQLRNPRRGLPIVRARLPQQLRLELHGLQHGIEDPERRHLLMTSIET